MDGSGPRALRARTRPLKDRVNAYQSATNPAAWRAGRLCFRPVRCGKIFSRRAGAALCPARPSRIAFAGQLQAEDGRQGPPTKRAEGRRRGMGGDTARDGRARDDQGPARSGRREHPRSAGGTLSFGAPWPAAETDRQGLERLDGGRQSQGKTG